MSRQKNKLPLFIGLAAAGAALYLYLRNKAAAGQNLRVEPVDALLNTTKTRQSLYTRLYYTVKLRLVNDEPAAVVVRGLNLAATANGRPFGNLVSADAFTVPAKSAQTVSLNASVATLGALGAILDILRGGRSVSVSIVGYADTDLGRVNVEYQTELSAAGVNGKRAVNGINGFTAYYNNPKTGGQEIRYFNNRTEEAAIKAANNAASKNQILVKIEKTKNYKTQYINKDKKAYELINKLKSYFGGKKYTEINEDTILRIADHSKNPYNDGKYNFDKRVISFVVPAYGGTFSGVNNNEYNLEGYNFRNALALIKSKIYK